MLFKASLVFRLKISQFIVLALLGGCLSVPLDASTALPLILVHGLDSSEQMWVDGTEGLVPYLNSLGYTNGGVIHFSLGEEEMISEVAIESEHVLSTSGDIWRVNFESANEPASNWAAVYLQARAVELAIARIRALTQAEQVILVGHSMGGLASSAYMVGDPDRDGEPDFYRNDVARLVTLGTPFGGSNLANLLDGFGILERNAIRDLAQSDGDHTNIFLFGGLETQVSSDFPTQDVSANGFVDIGQRLRGLNEFTGAEWPSSTEYFWVVGHWNGASDCIVDGVDQYLDTFGEVKLIHAAHSRRIFPTFTCPFIATACVEAKSFDAIVEALDEPDTIGGAWKVPLGQTNLGFLTQHETSGVDFDLFEVSLEGAGSITVSLAGVSVAGTQVRLLNENGQLACPDTCDASGDSGMLSLTYPFAFSSPTSLYVEVSGWVEPSDPGFGSVPPRSACNPEDTNCPNCRAPYSLVMTSDAGPSTVVLVADPTVVGPGQQTILTATVETPSGNPVPPGVPVHFSTGYSGIFTDCTGPTSSCTASTGAQGKVVVGFSSNINGSATIFASADTGGSDSTAVTIAQGTSQASANPNPVAVDLPSTLSVTILEGDGSTAPPGQVVTFSTTHPGFFTGNGASSTTSPSSVLTDTNGETWIWFASPVVGTALITIESGDATPITLPLEIFNPNADLNISLSVSFISGNDSSSQYELEAVVTNTSGNPIPGERVDFTTSRGSLSVAHDFTGPTGIADTRLTVTSSGDVTVTARAASETVATTFFAQVGTPPNAQMFPIRTFILEDEVMGISYTPTGDTLIAGDSSGNITAWNTSDWSSRWTATTADDRASQVSVSPDGARVLQTHDDGTDIFNVSNGSLVCSVTNSDSKGINGTFTSNSSFFDSSFANGFRHTSLCTAGSTFFTMPGSDDFDRRSRMAFSPERSLVAAGSADGNVYVWSTSGSLVRTEILTAGANDGGDVAFSSTGGSLAAVGWRTAKIYNTTSWSSSPYTPQQLGDDLWGVTFIDNDTKLAIGGVGSVEVLHVAGGSSFRVGDVSGSAWEMSWSPQRQELAVGTSGRNVFIFRPLDPIDVQPPIINISHPPESHVTNGPSLTTTGVVTDATGVDSFTINGVVVSLSAGGEFSHEITLVPGPNVLSYAATDVAGNPAAVSRTVTFLVDNTPPVISNSFVAPDSGQPGQLFGLTATVIDGDTGVASVTATVKAPGGATLATLPMADTSGNTYQANIDSIEFAIGFYTIDIVAVDSSPQANARTVTNAAGFEIEPPPSIAVSPSSTNFGSVEVGASADAVFTVTNTGGGQLTGSASTSAPFSVVSGSPYSLGHSQSSQVTVRFTPQSEGAAAANVTFSGGGGEVVSVSGFGFIPPAILTVNPNAVDFGLAEVGQCLSGSVTVGNDGASPLNGTASVLAPFWVTSGGAYTIAPGESSTVGLEYCPIHFGTHSEELVLTGGGGGTVDLTGEAIDPALLFYDGFESGNLDLWSGFIGLDLSDIELDPTVLPFGDVDVGSFVQGTVTVSNVGTATLNGTVTVKPPFSVVAGVPYSVPPSASTQVTLAFAPDSAGLFADSVTFSGGGGASLEVSGRGVPLPGIFVTPTSLDFGEVEVGAMADLAFIVENIGGGNLVGSASTTSPFSVIFGSPYELSAGESATVGVRFQPEAVGMSVEEVIFSGGEGDTRTASGTGVEGGSHGLISHWSFDIAGQPGIDVQGGFDATSVVGVTQAEGVIGLAGVFSAGYMQLPDVTELDLLTNDFTISAWVNGSPGGAMHWFTKATAVEHKYGLGYWPNTDGACLALFGGGGGLVCSTAVVFDGNWHHVAGVKRGTNAEIWIDGTLDGTTPITSTNFVDDGAFALGRDGLCCQSYTGQLDEAKIWSRALTESEIAEEAWAGDLLLADDFEDGDSSTWQTWAEGWSESGGIYHGTNTAANTPVASAFSGGYDWANYWAEVDVTPLGEHSPSDANLLVRFNEPFPGDDRCACGLSRSALGFNLWLHCGGLVTKTTPFDFSAGEAHRLRATAVGTNLSCEVLGFPAVRVNGSDPTLSLTGTVGFRGTHIPSDYDNLEVHSIGQMLIDEDFSDGLPVGFTIVGGGASATGGVLTLTSGCIELPQTYSRGQGLVVEADIQITNGSIGDFNIYGLYDDLVDCNAGPVNEGYWLGVYPTGSDNSHDRVLSRVGGDSSLLDEALAVATAGQWHRARFEMHPYGYLRVFLDGVEILTSTNLDHTSGLLALRTWMAVNIDNLRVWSMKVPQ